MLGAVHDLQVRLGASGKWLVARGDRRSIGRRAGTPARAHTEAHEPATACCVRSLVVNARLRDVGCGHTKLDDIRDHFRQFARRHGRGDHPEHHFRRCGCEKPGQNTRGG